jgi:Sua5/YciO/YrdC/YwlC family protein
VSPPPDFEPPRAGRAVVERAVAALRAGELVGFPTETVYGLGADATNGDALHRLYAAKGRPLDHPVIVHLGSTAGLDDWGIAVSPAARALAAEWWPGPLTLIVAASARVSRVATGGLDTVGLRVPAHPVALRLLEEFGGGIAAPSANRFGRVSPTTAEAVRAAFGSEVAMVLDGGPCAVGVESTIVDCTLASPRVLRHGAVTIEMLSELLGAVPAVGGTTRAPGTLASHYAPDARVEVVDTRALEARIRVLADAGVTCGVIEMRAGAPPERPEAVVTLATVASVAEYARVLYWALRKADDLGVDVVLAVSPPLDGIGAAVADRLQRAASDR